MTHWKGEFLGQQETGAWRGWGLPATAGPALRGPSALALSLPCRCPPPGGGNPDPGREAAEWVGASGAGRAAHPSRVRGAPAAGQGEKTCGGGALPLLGNPLAQLPAPLLLACPPVLPSLTLQRGLCLPLPPRWGQVPFPLNLADMGWSFYRRILRETDRKNKIQSINASERVSAQVKIPWLAESSVFGSADMQAVSPSSHPLLDWVG